MKGILEQVIFKYGTVLQIRREAGWEEFRGFLQPSRSESRQNILRSVTPAGEVPLGYYLFIGPMTVTAAQGDVLRSGGKEYLIRRLETIEGPEGPAYRWGLCTGKGEEDVWGTNG